MIEHDVDMALGIADRVTVMHDGRRIAEDTPAEIASDARVHDIYIGKHASR
jgi:branched-chain amino acid transport system ATP-binding protein